MILACTAKNSLVFWMPSHKKQFWKSEKAAECWDAQSRFTTICTQSTFIEAAAVIVYSNHSHKKMEHCKKLLISSNVILRQFLSAWQHIWTFWFAFETQKTNVLESFHSQRLAKRAGTVSLQPKIFPWCKKKKALQIKHKRNSLCACNQRLS